MSNSIVEAILSASGIAYDGLSHGLMDASMVSHFFIRSGEVYYVFKIGERNAYGVDYGIIEMEAADAQGYDACENIISDIDVGYVVMAESSYRPDGRHLVTEFAQLVIEHSKGTIIIKDSADQSGILVIVSTSN